MPMDLCVDAIAISNICFLRGVHSWVFFYGMLLSGLVVRSLRAVNQKIMLSGFM